MARSLCSCGAQVLWKADEPTSDELLVALKRDVPDELSWSTLLEHSAQAARCSRCGNLWIAWDGETLVEYSVAGPKSDG